ncbi:Scarecrow-like protein 1 [Vitis vinifera]|uniref:Scarecrow-like protein 1 n=1 Tax=Vitis vinifera TaxID=29760 RepID=A0A438HKV0_VITVI|nr:Scarecrow-like protein 1 [Vitis vinifera]
MSLVRSAELSAKAYGNPNLYSFKGSSTGPGFSAQIFRSDKRNIVYMTESYCGESNDPKYLVDSPTEELIHPPSSGISGRPFHPQGTASYQLIADSVSSMTPEGSFFESDYLECESPDQINYNEDKMRLKLQELERALLDDNDDDDDQSMEIDADWADPIGNELLHDSPKESSSSDSNLSSISSNKEVSLIPTRTTKQLLFDCAAALAEGNIDGASAMISELRQKVSIQGDPPQRIAAYMVEEQAGKKPHIRLTGVDDPDSIQRAVGGLKVIGQRLENLAEDLNLSFEFQAVASKTSNVTPGMLNCKPGEAL